MLRNCVDCGDQFEAEPGQFWKVRCLDCWLEKKAEEGDSTRRVSANPWVRHRPVIPQETAALRQQIAWLQASIDELERENRRLLCDLIEADERLRRTGDLAAELYENLPRLLQLSHPDRHGGSLASQKATQWLLSVRRLAPAVVEEEEVSS